ncbi:MAG: sigma-70 family RNA polymerase sigma factor [Lachnospiraceae bacterium]|nr:sigma-70 family RNA polymerase sigma factor [Lachnospiraceae bacterium]
MQKKELLKNIDDALLEKLYGFCYSRTGDGYEAQELCSDIVFALVKSSASDGEIGDLWPFVWKVARNVYADFSVKKSKQIMMFAEGDPEEMMESIPFEEESQDDRDDLKKIYRRIAFLTKAYREVMIMYYLDSLSTAEIAKIQGTSEVSVRQRLFSARKKIKSEVEEMNETYTKPLALDKTDFVRWGTGDPEWGDPSEVCTRMFSKHIVRLCNRKPRTATEIAEELNVPTAYVEEELEILAKGMNGEYGMLRRTDGGRYAINFILLEKDVIDSAQQSYISEIPGICDTVIGFVKEHMEEYLAFPYINKRVTPDLIMWQQVKRISEAFGNKVYRILKSRFFSDVEVSKRPFTIYGYIDNGTDYGGGLDGIGGKNICGYRSVYVDNIYCSKIAAHFHCAQNISQDALLQLAIRAIHGIDISTLSKLDKEHAAKAVECGYLFKDGDKLYTAILVNEAKDGERLFDVSQKLMDGPYLEKEAERVAEKIAGIIRKNVPDHLLPDWPRANDLANYPVFDSIVDALIEKGMLKVPENTPGSEGCWMTVEK